LFSGAARERGSQPCGRGLQGTAKGFKFCPMDGEQQAAIHQALVSVQHAVTSMTFPICDQEDLCEAIDSVEEQLHTSHPNLAVMCRFLNSIARSLRAQPEARDACLLIEDAIGRAGMPSTWQSGI
jgi:pyruvate/2-oxoglutarate dehydrogenase complex dihydrolipoamide acyltransferase (E2) component